MLYSTVQMLSRIDVQERLLWRDANIVLLSDKEMGRVFRAHKWWLSRS